MMIKHSRKRIVGFALLGLAAIAVIILALCAPSYLAAQNDTLTTTEYAVSFDKLPAAFDGYTMALITDLHSKEFGEGNLELLSKIDETKPDVVLVAGDTLDSRDKQDVGQVFLKLAASLRERYPVYYVDGNHEQRRRDLINEENTYYSALSLAGVQVIVDKKVELVKGGESINLYGLDLPYRCYKGSYKQTLMQLFNLDKSENYFAEGVTAALGTIDSAKVNILLTHNPKKFPAYAGFGADLVLCGHEHGGLIRLPWLGGLATGYASDGVKYDAGMFTKGTSSMIVSRGLGAAVVPYRINNKPELVIIKLEGNTE